MILFRKKWLASISFLFIFSIIFLNGSQDLFSITTTYAQQGGPLSPVYNFIELFLAVIVNVLQFIFHVVNSMIPIVWDQRLLFAINYNDVLLDMWKFSRNIVNIIFAIMLVVGAVITVIQANSSFIQQYYKKFFIAIILVNFSWFFPRVILDVAHVTTATIYQLPAQITEIKDCKIRYWSNQEEKIKDRECTIIVNYIFSTKFDATKTPLTTAGNAGWHRVLGMIHYCTAKMDGEGVVNSGDVAFCNQALEGVKSFGGRSSNVGYTMMNGIVMNFGRMADLTLVHDFEFDSNDKHIIKTTLLIIVQLFFIFFLLLTTTLSIIAIMIALAIRLVIIWLCISFMPFYFLSFVLDRGFGEIDTRHILTKYFIPAAFLPAFIAAPIAIGWTMLLIGNESFQCGADGLSGVGGADFEYMCDRLGIIFGTPALIEMLWMFLAIFIMWEGVFMAMRSNSYINKMTDGVKAVGDGAMKSSVKGAANWTPVPAISAKIQKVGGDIGGKLRAGPFAGAATGGNNNAGNQNNATTPPVNDGKVRTAVSRIKSEYKTTITGGNSKIIDSLKAIQGSRDKKLIKTNIDEITELLKISREELAASVSKIDVNIRQGLGMPNQSDLNNLVSKISPPPKP
jgi:hypothetical protein